MPGVPGAVIREVAGLPEHLAGGARIGPGLEVSTGKVLFEIPRLARFLVEDGRSIAFAACPGADRAAIDLFLHGAARGALIHQRGELALQAATLVAPNWKCVAIAGPSGFGKSTLAAALCQRGWLLVADDVTRVTWNGSMAIAWPSSDAVKLWRDAFAMVNVDPDRCTRVREGLERFHAPMPSAAGPAALSIIVAVRSAPGLGLVAFPPGECEMILSRTTYRPRLLAPLGRAGDHARIVAQVARVCRPLGIDGARTHPVEELADRLEQAVR